MEHPVSTTCPAGCTSPLCVFNEDEAGESEILSRPCHYGAAHALEVLLREAGLLETVLSESDNAARVRREDLHRAIDKVLVELKQAARKGNPHDLGQYDPRFAGLRLSWVPTQMLTREGPRTVRGAPHVLRIEKLALTGTAWRVVRDVPRVSGQPLSSSKN